jgi:hypothetical protein
MSPITMPLDSSRSITYSPSLANTTTPESGLKSLAISSITAEIAEVPGVLKTTIKINSRNNLFKLDVLRDIGYHPVECLVYILRSKGRPNAGPSEITADPPQTTLELETNPRTGAKDILVRITVPLIDLEEIHTVARK